MTTLLEQQQVFSICLAKLILYADSECWRITGGEWYRTPQEAARNAAAGTGIKNSLHCLRLAVDLNLFESNDASEWVLLHTVSDYRPLAEFWKSLDPRCRWGGDFHDEEGKPKPDADHFSMEWEGVK